MVFSLDQFKGLKAGDTALDRMQSGADELQASKNEAPMAPDGISPQMPAELAGKTIRQLKAMGAQEIASISSRAGTRGYGFESELSPEAEEKYRQALKELEDQDFDPDYFTDTLGVEGDNFEMVDGQLGAVTSKSKHDNLMARQKKLDDAAVALVLRALDTGVALPGDSVY